MPGLPIDGKALAASLQEALKSRVGDLTPRLGRKPCLAVVLVGDNPASQVYVKSKSKAAHACGMDTLDLALPKEVSNAELQTKLRELSVDPKVDGILLQLPLPKGLDEFGALMCIKPELDVDGLHPVNQGLLMRGEVAHRPCTPRGIIALIDQASIALGRDKSLAGLHAVVLGRSILVGKPVALLLLERHLTVTMCHSRTKELAAECRRADVLVAAIGKAEFVKGDFVKPGAIVIDVGINRTETGKLVGDVAFEEALNSAAAVTPVPGGVGPMTITMLLTNTVDSAEKRISK